jgi:hypothetical protein
LLTASLDKLVNELVPRSEHPLDQPVDGTRNSSFVGILLESRPLLELGLGALRTERDGLVIVVKE